MRVAVDDGLVNLDFSEEYPNLSKIELRDESHFDLDHPEKPLYLAKEDAGLGKNVNLKEIFIDHVYAQTPVSLSYLPSVEHYHLWWGIGLHDFDYLSQALPNLKTLSLGLFDYDKNRVKRAIQLENISKLERLENLNFSTSTPHWGPTLSFSDKEIEALSKMHKLKNITIEIRKERHENVFFDPEVLQTLKYLLPNLKIKIIIYIYYPPDG